MMKLLGKTARCTAIGAALLTSTSALAQWQGTWNTNENVMKLRQEGNLVYGELDGHITIQGLAGQRNGLFRGIARNTRTNGSYPVEFVLRGSKFEGKYGSGKDGLPDWESRANSLLGGRQNSAPPRLSLFRVAPSQASLFNLAPPRLENWMKGVAFAKSSGKTLYPERRRANANANSATAATTAPTDLKSFGSWELNIKGTEYGPLKQRRQFFLFSKPDANGTIVGYTPGGTIMIIGQGSNGNRRIRGVWMERVSGSSFATTGRWGLVEVRAAGDPATSMQAFFSVGYRPPSKSWAKNYAGMPGMEGVGKRVANVAPNTPSVGMVRSAWNNMVRKNSPFPAIHGLWPTAEIDKAIQAWSGGATQGQAFGGTTTVDPCAAECMGKEPTRVNVSARQIWTQKNAATRIQISGRATATAKLQGYKVDKSIPAVGENAYFYVRSSNPIRGRDGNSGDRFFFVEPPRVSNPFCETRNPSMGAARFSLPAGAWSDPAADVKLDYGGFLTEQAVGERNSQRLNPSQSVYGLFSSAGTLPSGFGWQAGLKASYQHLMNNLNSLDNETATIRARELKKSVCLINFSNFGSTQGRDTKVQLGSMVSVR